ncbi:MAG: DUF1871 family protein [Lachnospiraceae bacterium]|nr:DUF1871 family protein [Lachnospiraceae bacterium]
MSIIKKVIDEWDPIDLFPFAPDNEYEVEIADVEALVDFGCDADELAEGIYRIFMKAFGADVFRKTESECAEIAKKILAAKGSRP